MKPVLKLFDAKVLCPLQRRGGAPARGVPKGRPLAPGVRVQARLLTQDLKLEVAGSFPAVTDRRWPSAPLLPERPHFLDESPLEQSPLHPHLQCIPGAQMAEMAPFLT